jgi:hypothetical protein
VQRSIDRAHRKIVPTRSKRIRRVDLPDELIVVLKEPRSKSRVRIPCPALRIKKIARQSTQIRFHLNMARLGFPINANGCTFTDAGTSLERSR